MSDRKLKPDVFSHANLIMWLMLQPPDESYPAEFPDECMLFRWVRSIDPEAWFLPGHGLRGLYKYVIRGAVVDLVHFKDIAIGGESTFGAALKRAQGENTFTFDVALKRAQEYVANQ